MALDSINPSIEPLVLPVPTTPTAASSASSSAPLIDSPQSKMHIEQAPSPGLYGRVTYFLGGLEEKLDAIPNNSYQEKMDAIADSIQAQFSKLDGFNKWLDDNGQGEWYKQLATFLYKLPIRAVRNIVRMMYVLIKEILSFAVHPLKQLNKLARMLVNLAVELSKPETWAKIGAGVIGGSLGQAAVGNPLSVVGIGIGAAMMIGGLTLTAVKAAVKAEAGDKYEDAKEAVIAVAKDLPEVMLTGFLVGLLMGAIRKTVTEQKQITVEKPIGREQTIQWGRDFAAREGLPTPDFVRYNPTTGQAVLGWKYSLATEHTILKTHTWWGFNHVTEGGQTYSIAGIAPKTVPNLFTLTTSKVVPVFGAAGGPVLGATVAAIKA